MTSVRDRIIVITDLLLGAAYADTKLRGAEKKSVEKLLKELLEDSALPEEVLERFETFDAGSFNVTLAAQDFAQDPPINKRKLLELVAAVGEADEELDLSEDDYLRSLGSALKLDPEEYKDLTLDYEMEELKPALETLRSSPPPIPQD